MSATGVESRVFQLPGQNFFGESLSKRQLRWRQQDLIRRRKEGGPEVSKCARQAQSRMKACGLKQPALITPDVPDASKNSRRCNNRL